MRQASPKIYTPLLIRQPINNKGLLSAEINLFCFIAFTILNIPSFSFKSLTKFGFQWGFILLPEVLGISLYLLYKIGWIIFFLLFTVALFTSLTLNLLLIHSSVIPTTDFLFEDSGLSSPLPPFLNTFAIVSNLNLAAYNLAAENLKI
jgi:hypothetical protein